MTNVQIAAVFDLIADLLEFQGANQFRVRAYRNAALTIHDHAEEMATILNTPDRKLTDIAGVGDDLAQKITTLVQGGQLSMLDELKAKTPESVLAMVRIPGLGPKKAAVLHKELGINTLDELRAACEAGKLRVLKGFGAKTEQTILAGIPLAATANLRLYWAEADSIAQRLKAHLCDLKAVEQCELAGSYRRGCETVGDLDVLVTSSNPAAVMEHFAKLPGIEEVLARGDTKMSIRVTKNFQIDLRVVPAESFGAALQYFTGSKNHNVVIRGMAKDRGLKINEWGVYRVNGENETRVAGATEAEVYATLDLPVFPPELRENRNEFAWAEAGALPRLIQETDMRGDLHMHTTASDGGATLAEMVAAAQGRGLEYIAITDHSKRSNIANGLDATRLLAQWAEIDSYNEKLADENSKFVVLKGVEVDILEAGGLDLPDDVLAQADWVNASVHYGQKQPREQITERILGALENPYVCVVAHPTGRLLNRREPYAVDMEAVFAAAKKYQKFLELNANPARLDLNDVYCAAAKNHGIPIVISTDAHSTEGLACMRYGILQGRRGGLTNDDVVNTRAWKDVKKLLGRK